MKSCVIIGAGLGGLFSGAILAKEGIHVTILEKNATIGGGLQSFRRYGEVFDTGMHVIGGMHPGGNIRRICEYLGVYDDTLIEHVNPTQAAHLYVAEDGMAYDISEGREGFIESLVRYFPHQKEQIISYVDAIFRLVDEVPLYHLLPADALPMHSEEFFMPADAFIARYITDPKLQSVVAFMTPLYSGSANVTPAFVHSIISTLCINGTSQFIGGSSLFADKLRDVIIVNGGEVYTSEGVCRINTQDRSITSLTTKKNHTFTADYYISDIHPATLLQYLDDPKALPKAYRMRLENIPNAYSAFTLNIKFKADSFPYIDHTVYYMEHYGDAWHYGDERWPLGFLYMTPPESEQGTFTRKMIVTVPMAWDKVKTWENTTFGHRPADYKAWKEQCADEVIDRIEMMNPGFRSCIEAVNTASPLTIRDFYGIKEGSMCGYQKDCNNITYSHLTVGTKIPNLLLTGQNVNLHGFCGVPLTSIKTCEAILGENYIINKLNA